MRPLKQNDFPMIKILHDKKDPYLKQLMNSKSEKTRKMPNFNANDLKFFWVNSGKNLAIKSTGTPNFPHVKPVQATMVLFETNEQQQNNQSKFCQKKNHQETLKV